MFIYVITHHLYTVQANTAPQAREEMELKLLNDPVVNQKVVEMQKTDKHTSCNSYTYI